MTARFAAVLLMCVLAAPAVAQPQATPPTKPVDPEIKQPEKPAEPVRPEVKKPDHPTPAPTPPAPPKETLVYVMLKTSMGDITLELNQTKAPISVENFLKYLDKGHYNGTIFHRVINGFMIQGGGFDREMSQKAVDKPIKNEWQNGLKNNKYTIAMARLGGRADSATSQFFINVKDNPGLDQPNDGSGYAVFGKCVAGIEVVDKIKGVATGSRGGMQDVPVEPVTVAEARRLTADECKPYRSAEKK